MYEFSFDAFDNRSCNIPATIIKKKNVKKWIEKIVFQKFTLTEENIPHIKRFRILGTGDEYILFILPTCEYGLYNTKTHRWVWSPIKIRLAPNVLI